MSLLQRFPALSFGFVSLALLSLTGCGDDMVYDPPQEPANPALAIDIAPVAPPALSDEFKTGLTDRRTQVWRPGHWIYETQRFAWVPGEVLTRPSPTAVWSPDRWEHRSYGWVYIHGYWQ